MGFTLSLGGRNNGFKNMIYLKYDRTSRIKSFLLKENGGLVD